MGQYKDLTETGNRARKVSGTQGTRLEIFFFAVTQYESFHLLFIHLFIHKLRQEAWITHRASSTTRSRAMHVLRRKLSKDEI